MVASRAVALVVAAQQDDHPAAETHAAKGSQCRLRAVSNNPWQVEGRVGEAHMKVPRAQALSAVTVMLLLEAAAKWAEGMAPSPYSLQSPEEALHWQGLEALALTGALTSTGVQRLGRWSLECCTGQAASQPPTVEQSPRAQGWALHV